MISWKVAGLQENAGQSKSVMHTKFKIFMVTAGFCDQTDQLELAHDKDGLWHQKAANALLTELLYSFTEYGL